MRALLLSVLVMTSALAGCTNGDGGGTVDRDRLDFAVVSDVGGATPFENGTVEVAGEHGVEVRAEGSTLVVGLGSALLGDVVRACVRPCAPLDVVRGTVVADGGLVSLHNLSLNAGGPDGDSAVYFHDGGSETGRFLRWADAQSRFQLNADLLAVGNLTATHHVGTTTPLVLSAPGSPVVTVSTAAIEGLEMAIFARGSAELANETSVFVPFNEAFAALVGPEFLTAQVTLTSPGSTLYVAEKTRDGMRVATANGEPATSTFDWFVQASRVGAEGFEI